MVLAPDAAAHTAGRRTEARKHRNRTLILPRARCEWLLLAAILAAATAYGAFGLRVYRTLHASAFDLAFFDQILWNTAHGRWFETTYVSYNFLGQHFEPILLPLALLYRLGAGPQTLIALQAAGVAIAAVPLYLAGRRLLPPLAALLVACAYLLAPALQRAVDFGFHSDMFEPLAAFTALAALLWRRDRLLLLAAALVLLVKEDAFLIVLGLGWIALLRGRPRLGFGLMTAALVWGALVLTLIMPMLRHGASSDLAERYGYLGSAPTGIVVGALRHPDRIVAHLAAPTPAIAVFGLLASFAFVPLLAPDVLLAALPPALLGLLSTHPQQRALDVQYGVPVLIMAAVAALFGVERASRRLKLPLLQPPRGRSNGAGQRRLACGAAACVAAAALASGYLHGPFPPERDAAGWRFREGGSAAALARVARLITAGATLSAQTGLAPHLSQRRVQWEFPRLSDTDEERPSEDAEYIVLQSDGIRSSQSLLAGFDQTVAALPQLGYRLIASDGTIRLYRRGDAAGPGGPSNEGAR
ncbi:MAG TPA: DUF2079 domain-containing protein [Dehalococcoidia bacterium]